MQVACNHSNNLNDTEFDRLIRAVEKCILHVVGGRNSSTTRLTSNTEPLKTSVSLINTYKYGHENAGFGDAHFRCSESVLYDPKEAGMTRSSTQSTAMDKSKHNKSLPPSVRFSKDCSDSDKKREKELLEKRYIGKILDQQRVQHVITATEVNFRWQLGLLIGKYKYHT